MLGGVRMTRVAIYARVYTDRQEVESQPAQMRRFAESQQSEIKREYIDHETGKHADREQFKKLFEDGLS
jgi:DNA invertase Pin-like site-specific DNA recombinase